ncbi:hypothetical protein N780_01950 [Pontibacillus chungwhensis BH030062]|uniref:DUF4352 domain-containing protein n=1 Tax=Pontibacillus chungwhensis BH030062 TaxID=1385513 RepID=A0A0A2V073_9BACI|nr:DUF4352 domain-containing protein [Pontibacillus chungwhensis]KGP92403.1 hypothetical protein N780_01950 [Pontibacillus chungwhensis BH030062]
MKKKKIWLIISLTITVVIIGACAQSEAKNSSEEKVYKSIQNDTNSSKNTSETTYKGETIKQGDLKLTLHSVRETSKGAMEPENDKFIIADITIENTGDKVKHVSVLMNFDMYNDEGDKQKHTVSPQTDGEAEGELPPGGSLNGEIAFDVEEADSYELMFKLLEQPGWVSWKINESDL